MSLAAGVFLSDEDDIEHSPAADGADRAVKPPGGHQTRIAGRDYGVEGAQTRWVPGQGAWDIGKHACRGQGALSFFAHCLPPRAVVEATRWGW